MKEKIQRFIRKISVADYLFFLTIIIYLILVLGLLTKFVAMPSPIYGGDYYHSLGMIEHYLDGGSAFEHSAMKGDLPIYFPLYTILVGSFAKILSLTAFQAIKYFNIIFIILSVTVLYVLFSKLIRNKYIGLGMTMLYLAPIPIFKYLQFTIGLILPLFILMLYLFFKKQNYIYAILLGITLGIVGISHSVGTIFAFFTFGIFSCYFLVIEYINIKDRKIRFRKADFLKSYKKRFILIFLAGMIGLSIAMLYWYEPLIVYHGKTINPYAEYAEVNLDIFSNKIYLFMGSIKSLFFNFGNPLLIVTSILTIIGFGLLIILRNSNEEIRFIYIIMISGFINSYIYLIGVNLIPDYLMLFSIALISPILIGFSIYIATEKFKKYSMIILVIFLMLCSGIVYKSYINYKTDRWTQNGMIPLESHLTQAKSWIDTNTDVDTVFISTNELSYAINAITGRKFLNFRLSHAGGWTDNFERMRDSAIILYGNNDSLRKDLIKKYDVQYLYWNYYWIQSEMQFDEQGRLAGFFDPLIVYDTKENRDILTRLNISFYPQHTWIDPGNRNDRIKKFDILYILPKEMSLTHPWSKELDPYLEEVWNYTENGNTAARMYRIKT